jgi:hypothetical protein
LNECEEGMLGTDAFDFDSDGDGIPDYLELIYNFNPIVSDIKLDSNGDGIPNLVNLTHGLSPNLEMKVLDSQLVSNYEVNFLGKEQIFNPTLGSVWEDLYELKVHNIPSIPTAPVDESKIGLLYGMRQIGGLSRVGAVIPPQEQLIARSSQNNTNQILAVARMVDQTNHNRIYWSIFKGNFQVGNHVGTEIHMGDFIPIRTMTKSH